MEPIVDWDVVMRNLRLQHVACQTTLFAIVDLGDLDDAMEELADVVHKKMGVEEQDRRSQPAEHSGIDFGLLKGQEAAVLSQLSAATLQVRSVARRAKRLTALMKQQ